MDVRALVLVAGRDPRHARSGHDTYVRVHACAAQAAGWRPWVVCAADDDALEDDALGVVRRVASRRPDHRNLHAPFHARALADAIVGEARTRGWRAVLVHGFGLWAGAAVASVGRLRRAGVPSAALASLYTAHDHEVRARLAGVCAAGDVRGLARALYEQALALTVVRRAERDACRGADRVLVNYRAVASALVRRHGPRVRPRVVPYAAEAAFGPPPPARRLPRPARPVVLAVSRHAGNKGLDVLLRALALLARRGVEVEARLAGGGPLLATHRRLAARLGIADRVHLPGEVVDVAPLLADADLFVLPSRQEGSGSLALLEATAAGVAVVASAVDGIPEDVAHGRTGWLVPPGDPVRLADALAHLLADPALREELARRAAAEHAERFSARRLTAALGAVYADALGAVQA